MTAAINWFHLLLVVPVLLYIINFPTIISSTSYNVLFITLAIVYLSLFKKLIDLQPTVQMYEYKKMILWMHLLLILPLMLYISSVGITNQTVPRRYYEFVWMFVFAAIGYHAFNLVRY